MKLFIRLSIIIMLLGIMALPSLANLYDGLLLYFTFDEVNGDTVINSAGNGHDGILEADAKVIDDPAKYGTGALQIDGGSQAMTVETFTELEEYQENTLIFWINFTAPASGGWDQIIAKPAPGSDRSPGLWVTPEGLSIHYRYEPGNLGPWGVTPTGNQNGEFFEEGIWYHVAGVTQDGEVTCYVDGVEVCAEAVPAEIAQGAGGFHVGNSPAYAGAAARFIADDVALYNRALSEDEILSVMEGAFLAVEASDKLASTWGSVKDIR
ncbi:hypothetical protein GF312_16490 [Candidatus Poribacteria bacterium]|nr:hypothetical protein [Candidatus Poribacteria bacterium]